MPEVTPPEDWPLLFEDALACPHDPGLSVLLDHAARGAVARRDAGGTFWRALDDDVAGPLLLAATPRGRELVIRGWSSVKWAGEAAPAPTGWNEGDAFHLARAWVGLDDDGWGEEVLDGHPLTRELRRRLGPLRLSSVLSVQEAVGRAVLGQLVQFREAERSAAQLVRLAGREVGGLHAWPTQRALLKLETWDLRRRCGMSMRGVAALRAAAFDDARLSRLAREHRWDEFDAVLGALPGVGVWTSAVARLALGDPDAVPFGDYHLPSLVCHALSDGAEPPGGWTDAHLAELLEPFRPQRGRVVRLLLQGAMRRQGPRPARRAPHAPLSAHRYW
ncbi:MAG TPA: hypothetical protein VNU01_03485 [Egibacteraceae bacterium]|nr:hypothetical protein [Egibacteraceae bacterium]